MSARKGYCFGFPCLRRLTFSLKRTIFLQVIVNSLPAYHLSSLLVPDVVEIGSLCCGPTGRVQRKRCLSPLKVPMSQTKVAFVLDSQD